MQQGLIEIARADPRLAGHVLVATSGSSGKPKWIALSKRALLASAAAVNAHLGATADDRWLCALPDFHVGGIGVHSRAYLLGQAATVFRSRWQGRAREFAALCERDKITLTSLTPTQVFDLVAEELAAPSQLRVVIVGGGRLDGDLKQRATALGWPLWESYGMTEAASQIATGPGHDEGWLPVLPHWDISSGSEGRLRIRGTALFSGTLTAGKFREANVDLEGWFEATDRVEIRGRELRFIGRADDLVKVRGELVSLDEARRRLDEIAGPPSRGATVMAVPDERLGHRLIAVFEGQVDSEVVARFNDGAAPFARLEEARSVPSFPRTALGKIAWGRLADLLRHS